MAPLTIPGRLLIAILILAFRLSEMLKTSIWIFLNYR
jgi:hypothetical protein